MVDGVLDCFFLDAMVREMLCTDSVRRISEMALQTECSGRNFAENRAA